MFPYRSEDQLCQPYDGALLHPLVHSYPMFWSVFALVNLYRPVGYGLSQRDRGVGSESDSRRVEIHRDE